ncbi:hypothetical protein DID74_02380 [Candidatus Marinamargulisbacteria bacterium SCGC AG-333-B06]|nr:hypothetical protein DID74_02380 [Candidatus Marinamargulisbacteria bacterium SCGC AG-333-B06]
MEKLKAHVRFVHDSQKRLILTYEVFYKKKKVSLNLTELMQFLYEKEQSLKENESTFLYFISRVTKKFSYQSRLIYGIVYNEEILNFFLKSKKYNVLLNIFENKQQYKFSMKEALPISLIVEQVGYKLVAKLLNKKYIKKHITHFLILKNESQIYLYSAGILQKIDKRIETFLNRLLDRPSLVIDRSEDISTFMKRLYQPYKNCFHWEIIGNIKALLPEEISPNPLLTVNYDGQCLHPLLSFEYGNEIIDSNNKESEVIDRQTGKKMIRQPAMEDVFLQDLMGLFDENKLPFLLSNPGDIAKFFDSLVPELKNREWKINSNVDDFNVLDDPLTLSFEITSSKTDWFEFDPNCNIEGEKRSLLEISRLLVENQGYIKTKKGFVKLSQSTQEELKLLKQYGAFNIGKTFSKKEILPIMMMSNTRSETDNIKTLISKVNSFNVAETKISDDFNGVLRPYQHYGVHWMNLLSNVQLGGVLADDMGLGKTVQTLAFTSLMNKKGPVLVVCPTNVLYNWEKEIKRFLPKKKSMIYGGAQRQQQLDKFKRFDYIIISYGILKNDIEYLKAVLFETILVDEAQAIKNPQAQVSKAIKQLSAKFKLVMTGTPIENHLQDIWNLFDFVMPNYLGSKSQFELLVKQENKEFLRSKIKPFVLRREKREVLDSLPEKTEITLECPLSEQQMDLYKTVLEVAKKGVATSGHKRDRLNMLTALLKLRQVCTHPGIVEEFKGLGIESAKFNMLKEKSLELIDEGHKVVVFSQFTSMLDLIETWLDEQGINHVRIDGSVSAKKRMDLVEEFQTNESPMIFLVSLKAGGIGLNLTAADYVIHIDPWWNPAIEAQATDRVHRMGQTNKVIVYRLICAGTIEEKINRLQQDKKKLLAEIVDIDGASEKQIDFNEIKSLILN